MVCFVCEGVFVSLSVLKKIKERDGEVGREKYKDRRIDSQRDSTGFSSACFKGQIHHTVISCRSMTIHVSDAWRETYYHRYRKWTE